MSQFLVDKSILWFLTLTEKLQRKNIYFSLKNLWFSLNDLCSQYSGHSFNGQFENVHIIIGHDTDCMPPHSHNMNE